MKTHIDRLFDALTDLVPAKYRKVVHELLSLILVIASLWLAAEQNWAAFLTFLGSAYTASNASNTFESPADLSELDPQDEHDEALVEFEYVEEAD